MKTTYKTYSDQDDVEFTEFETAELPENHSQLASEYLAKQESDFEKKFGRIDKTPIMATRGRHQLFALFGLQGNRVRGVAREITRSLGKSPAKALRSVALLCPLMLTGRLCFSIRMRVIHR
jgi:hypothetical protein